MFDFNEYSKNIGEKFKKIDINLVESLPFFYKDYYISFSEEEKPMSPMNDLTMKQREHLVENFNFFRTLTEPFNILLKNEENSEILKNFKEQNEKTKIIDLRSDTKKIVFFPHKEYSHFIRDHVGPCLQTIVREKNNIEVIIFQYSETGNFDDFEIKTYHKTFIKMLDLYNINYKIFFVHHKFKNIYLINNYYWIACHTRRSNFYRQMSGGYKITKPEENQYFDNLIYNFYKPLMEDIKPFRKVYLSRSKNKPEENRHLKNFYDDEKNIFFHKLCRPDLTRIDDEKKLENFFKQLDFEIVYPEDFEDFEKQVKFMNEIKIFVSISGSGFTNIGFMQEEQTIVEIVTTLFRETNVILNNFKYVDDIKQMNNIEPNKNGLLIEEQLHTLWNQIAFWKKHFYIGIPNKNQKSDDVIEFINNNKYIKNILMN